MKILFIGGTGIISTAVSKLVLKKNDELYVLNRGNNNNKLPKGVKFLKGDINNEEEIKDLLKGYYFDAVVQWIAYTPEQVKRDYNIFNGLTKQYVFISSASAYQKPVPTYPITEEVPLDNPYWDYSDNKKQCEEYLQSISSDDFNVTIIRPSHTYDEELLIYILTAHGKPMTQIDRILKGKKVIIPGDGTSLWTITYNADFAVGFIEVLGNPKAYNEAFHITSNIYYTWEQINEIICNVLGVKPNVIHIPTDFIVKYAPQFEGGLKGDKMWSGIFDNSKIKKLAPNFNPQTRYEDIVPIQIKRIMENPDLQTIDYEHNDIIDKIISEYEARINSN
ncbi:MAG: UDP-glucose 4-epimerase [Candidatus Izimaplasma bacterium HR2]|nr:MAG: UDP-glucose 4-epimerase [Candidatus Izimaplasma bacterium HR2]